MSSELLTVDLLSLSPDEDLAGTMETSSVALPKAAGGKGGMGDEVKARLGARQGRGAGGIFVGRCGGWSLMFSGVEEPSRKIIGKFVIFLLL